jgi:RNA recognition motif. (a.k.a. RRM, RBD, or RNP domain)
MAEEDSHLGLGYSSTPSEHHDAGVQDDDGESGSSSAVAGDMLRILMQQCLAYHLEQQKQQEAPESFSHFQPSLTETGTAASEPIITVNPNPADSKEAAAQEGRARANAILEKFQRRSREHGVIESSCLSGDGKTTATTATPASELRMKRENCLAQESLRKKQFWVKNLEYVTKRDRQRLQHQLAQVEEAKQWETQVQEHYLLALEERKKRLRNGSQLISQAGIGSVKRKRVEKEKNRTSLGHFDQQADASVSIYVKGIPTDGSVAEETIKNLFSSYGTIRKVHFYRNKQTSTLKGDALVVFQATSKGTERETVLKNVCSQVRACPSTCWTDLPCQRHLLQCLLC